MYACYFHFDAFHFTVAHTYAKLGNPRAQHIVGERLLYGKGVEMDKVSIRISWPYLTYPNIHDLARPTIIT
jgi:hypothetical protein